MKVIDFKSQNKEYKGYIKIEVPNFKQRLQYIKESGFEVGNDVKLADNIDALLKLVDISEKHIKEVNIKIGNEKVSSWEDILNSPSCDGLIQEIAGVMVNGIRLGEA